jgi:hypothetical protein
MAYLYIGAGVLVPVSILIVVAFLRIKADMDENMWS